MGMNPTSNFVLKPDLCGSEFIRDAAIQMTINVD
jgi:hypothetical protein